MLNAQKPILIDWKSQSEFSEFPEKLGLAGIGAAKIGNGFLMVGGANFPELLPYEGGKKFYSDKIFFWDGTKNPPEELALKLPEPGAYFGYTFYDNSLILVGGETSNGPSSKVNQITQKSIKNLPELPVAVTSPTALNVDDKIYLIGGDTPKETLKQFLRLDLSKKNPSWERLPNLPKTVANAAVFFSNNSIYVASGRSKNSNGISTLSTEIFRFDLKKKDWQKEGDILIEGKKSPFVAPAFFSHKNRYLIFAGGDDGKIFHQIETYLNKISQVKDEDEKQNLLKDKNYLVKHHQGFNNKVLIYDTKTKKWLPESYLPFPAQVTTASVTDGDNIYIFSGETRPGVRTPKILKGTIK